MLVSLKQKLCLLSFYFWSSIEFLVDWSNKTIIDTQSEDKNQSLTQVSRNFSVKQEPNEIQSDDIRSDAPTNSFSSQINVHHQNTEKEDHPLVIENLDFTYETARDSDDSTIDSTPNRSCPSGHKPTINYFS